MMLAFATTANALEIQLPAESASYKPSDLPGYRLVQQNCLICHSAQYAQYQPASSPRAYWDATVKKMKKPFNAPFAEADIPAMVDYLVKTYGTERGAPVMAPVVETAAPPSPVVVRDASALLSANGCLACHAVDKKVVGPSFKDVAAKYAGKPDATAQLKRSIHDGGVGKWGQVPMPPFDTLSDGELAVLAAWVLER